MLLLLVLVVLVLLLTPEQQVQMVLTQYLVYPLQLLPLVVAVVVDLVHHQTTIHLQIPVDQVVESLVEVTVVKVTQVEMIQDVVLLQKGLMVVALLPIIVMEQVVAVLVKQDKEMVKPSAPEE
tara:strand:- start:209 stop:577 length:369 start_codon:yes stop_codon:yes gene_type:complete